MAIIENSGKIIINRGECFQAPLFINIGTDEEPIRLNIRELASLDIEVYLGIHLSNQLFEYSFIRKIFNYLDTNEYGDIIISLDPLDTINILPGNYMYSIKARMLDPDQGDWVATVIDRNLFILK